MNAQRPAIERPGAREDRASLHVLDATMLYTPAGGGVMRYLVAKRRWLATHTSVRHTLLVPGADDGEGAGGECFVRSSALPGVKYRMPADTGRWGRAIAARRPDVVEIGDAGPVALAALRVRRRADFALVAFCHSDIERSARTRYGNVTAWATRTYARLVYAGADRVIAPSDYMRRRLAEWGVHHVTVCPLGTDLALFTPQRRDESLRDALGLAEGTRLLVYAGRFAPEKNLETLIGAFARLGSRYHLLLVGAGDLPALPRNVTVRPFEDDATALARVVASADAFVHAGDQETFGLGYVEAMACGVPVIATSGGAAPEIVAGGCGFVVPPRDQGALADAVQSLYRTDRARMGRAARQRAVDRYDWNKAFSRILHVYAAVAGAHPSIVPQIPSTTAASA